MFFFPQGQGRNLNVNLTMIKVMLNKCVNSATIDINKKQQDYGYETETACL